MRSHDVDGVGQVFPRAGDALHLRLAAELAFGTDFARDAGDFRGECVELVDHRVDRVFELEDLAAHSTVIFFERSPLATAVVTSAMLRTWDVRFEAMKFTDSVRSFHVPETPDLGLTAEFAFGADFARDARHFGREAVELIDHGVDRVLEFRDLAADVDGDLFREVAGRDGGRDVGDVANLRSKVRGHDVDGIRQSFHVPETPPTSACPPRMPSEPTSRATRVTSEANELS